MRRVMQAHLSVVLTIVLASGAFGQSTWRVQNDTEIEWMFELKSADQLNTQYKLPQGGTVTLRLGNEPHYLETWYSDVDPQKKPELQRLGPIFVRNLIMDSNINKVSQIRSPLKIWGNRPFTDKNGNKIYIAMDNFPYDDNRYGAFLNDLRSSKWIGPNGWTLDLSRNRARRPNDARDTVLKNVQYVPGERYYVVAEWYHDGATGEMFLVADPNTPNRLVGNYKYGGWQPNAISANRIGGQQGGNVVPMP